jgi:hypothetical protein
VRPPGTSRRPGPAGALLRRAPATRVLSALLAAVALLGACSDDDDRGFPGAAATDAGAAGGDEAPGEGVCALLTPARLLEVTGVDFGAGELGEGTCTYTARDGVATLGVHRTELTADADLALETTSSTCDEGSSVELDLPGTDGAFGCTVTGVVVAAGASDTRYVVLTAASLGDPARPAEVMQDLGELLAEALTAG